jgi:hypothetical protein
LWWCRLAIIVEGAIESWPDFGILFGIQMLNASLSYYEITKAGDAVAALKVGLHTSHIIYRPSMYPLSSSLAYPGLILSTLLTFPPFSIYPPSPSSSSFPPTRPPHALLPFSLSSPLPPFQASLKPKAHAKRDGNFVTLDAAELVPGDLVLLGSGSAVPADCLINHGTIDVDQAALTGESLPVTMFEGDSAKMGSTVVRGEVEATVDATGKNTFFGKTATLLSVRGLRREERKGGWVGSFEGMEGP